MEKESRALVDFVQDNMAQSPHALSLDVHSGFGMKDRLWFPYAKTTKDFPYKREAYRIKELLDRTLPHHIYTVEPQSQSYTASGDLWDYLFEQSQTDWKSKAYIPWTLELGSWMWVKKIPGKFFRPSVFLTLLNSTVIIGL